MPNTTPASVSNQVRVNQVAEEVSVKKPDSTTKAAPTQIDQFSSVSESNKHVLGQVAQSEPTPKQKFEQTYASLREWEPILRIQAGATTELSDENALAAAQKAWLPIFNSSDVTVIDYGAQALTRQTIGHVARNGKLLGNVQTHASKHGAAARLLSLVDKKGQIVGFGSPYNGYEGEVKTWSVGAKELVRSAELLQHLRKGELRVGEEYFKVFQDRQEKVLIGLVQVPKKYEASREYFEQMVTFDPLSFLACQ